MKIKSLNLTFTAAIAIALTTMVGCAESAEPVTEAEPVVVETEEVVEEAPVAIWVVSEDKINNIPVVTKPEAKPADKTAAKPAADKKAAAPAAAPTADKVVTTEALKTSLVAVDYEPVPVTVTEAIVPLDDTQTVMSFNNKGEAKDAVQVVSDGNGNVDQIVFADKRHTDVYNVQNGMTTKEVKELRKDMKHMMKHGKAFLYNDSSNVMYLLDIQDGEGDEITDAQIENSSVSAIIWKDKAKAAKK